MLKVLIVLTTVLFLYGCENEDNETHLIELIELVNENKAKWISANISTYTYTYSRYLSDCGIASPLPPAVVSVVNNKVSSVYIPAIGVYESSIDGYLTVQDIFEHMLQEIDEKPLVFSISVNEQNQLPEFNAQYGYPINYYVDLTSAECDAHSVSIRELQ